ncbi:MAG: polyprenyl synthetase family protein [Thermoguttaceae bacterium]|nr:polyprenyl synthetase family protein [Thermoguttaceae bacterium]
MTNESNLSSGVDSEVGSRLSYWGRSLSSDASVASYLENARGRINAALDERVSFGEDVPDRLAKAMRHSLLAPGKRLRPTLALIANELCGGDARDVFDACVALEAVHVFTLVHDDLPAMDDDDYRRGVPTCHKEFDEATAILAGDALLALAFEILSSGARDGELAVRLVSTLARAVGVRGTIGGQEDDVLWAETMKSAPGAIDLFGELAKGASATVDVAVENLLNRIHRRKTGALIVASLEMGAISARANARQIEALRQFGAPLGRAFQISDDLLDAIGNEADMGKRVRKDEDAGKLTCVSLFGVEKTKSLLKETADRAREVLTESSHLFDAESLSFKAALLLVELTERRER